MKWNSLNARSIIILVFFLFSIQSYALSEWHEFYNNTRSLGMGGATVAITSDDTAIYRNPANLGSIRDVYGTVFDPEIEGTGSLTATQVEVSSVMATLASKTDTYYHAKQQLSPVLIRRNIGLGFISKTEISAEVTSVAPTVMDTVYVNDLGVVIGSNLRLADGIIKIGGSARFFNRIEVRNPTLSVSGPTDLQTIGSEGTAIALDAALMIQAPVTYIPTFSLVARDVGNTIFDKQDGFRMRTLSRPVTVNQSIDAGVAISPIHSNRFRSVWTLEYTDIGNSRNDTDSAKRMHFGVEFNTRDLFFLRLGYNQRYVTAGFEIASEYWLWQVSSYGEEIGTTQTPREDRRLSMKVAVRF